MMPGDDFYRSKVWHRLKALVRRRSGGICEVPGCTSPAKICDHIISRRKGGEDALHNLRDLCQTHDNQIKEDAHGVRRRGGRMVVLGADASGWPVDPGHPWNAPDSDR